MLVTRAELKSRRRVSLAFGTKMCGIQKWRGQRIPVRICTFSLPGRNRKKSVPAKLKIQSFDPPPLQHSTRQNKKTFSQTPVWVNKVSRKTSWTLAVFVRVRTREISEIYNKRLSVGQQCGSTRFCEEQVGLVFVRVKTLDPSEISRNHGQFTASFTVVHLKEQ